MYIRFAKLRIESLELMHETAKLAGILTFIDAPVMQKFDIKTFLLLCAIIPSKELRKRCYQIYPSILWRLPDVVWMHHKLLGNFHTRFFHPIDFGMEERRSAYDLLLAHIKNPFTSPPLQPSKISNREIDII